MVVGRGDLEVDSDEFQVGLERPSAWFPTAMRPCIWATNLPFETLGVKRRSAMTCTARVGENEQLVGSVRLRPLRELVGGISGQRELVEEALDRCRDCKEGIGVAVGASTAVTFLAFGGHCDGS